MKENFEQKRQEMMRELSRRRRENVVKRKVSMMQKNASESLFSIPVAEKRKIAVYGADSFFIKNLINSLKLTNDVLHDADAEKLIEKILSLAISNVVTDLDEPTDWRKSVDVFTTVRTLYPLTQFYVCTKNPDRVHVEGLAKQGAIILKKPIDFDYIYRSLK